MKTIILSLLSLCTTTLFAQTFTFQLTYNDGISDDVETTSLEVNVATGKLSARLKEDGMTEYMFADASLKKVVELLDETSDEETIKEAYISTWEEDLFDEAMTISYASDLCLLPIATNEEYRLLTETKVLHGLTCTKVELLADGEVVGTGWLAKGVYIKLTDDLGMFLTKEGSIVDCTLGMGGETTSCKLLSYSKTVVNPTAAFNMTVPSGYEIIDDTEEGGDEYYYDEEEEE